MVLTFAQYSILKATYTCATYSQVENQTSFDRLMIRYYIVGLLSIGLINAIGQVDNETTCYELTSLGLTSVDEYERSNPSLIINRTSNNFL